MIYTYIYIDSIKSYKLTIYPHKKKIMARPLKKDFLIDYICMERALHQTTLYYSHSKVV